MSTCITSPIKMEYKSSNSISTSQQHYTGDRFINARNTFKTKIIFEMKRASHISQKDDDPFTLETKNGQIYSQLLE